MLFFRIIIAVCAACLSSSLVWARPTESAACTSGTPSCPTSTAEEAFESLGDETSFIQTYTVVHKRGKKKNQKSTPKAEAPQVGMHSLGEEELDDYVSF